VLCCVICAVACYGIIQPSGGPALHCQHTRPVQLQCSRHYTQDALVRSLALAQALVRSRAAPLIHNRAAAAAAAAAAKLVVIMTASLSADRQQRERQVGAEQASNGQRSATGK
jgi:hypothetical protein